MASEEENEAGWNDCDRNDIDRKRYFSLGTAGIPGPYRDYRKGAGGEIRRMTTDHTRDNVTFLRCYRKLIHGGAGSAKRIFGKERVFFLLCSTVFGPAG